jgi:hypothetical protein
MIDSEETGGRAPLDASVIAVLGGCALLVIAALAAPRLVPQQPYAVLLGAGAAAGALLWTIAFALTLRRASMPWKLASLAILAGAGAIAGLIAHSQYQTRARADASSFAEVEFGPQGAPQLPAGVATRGPASRLLAASVAADAQAKRDYAAAFGALGAGNLNSPYLLQQDPRVLGRCGEVEGIKTMARDQYRQRLDRQGALERAIQSANLPAKAKQGMAMMAGAPLAHDQEDAVLANQIATLDATGELCTLLARRGWSNAGGYFGFGSSAEKARFDALGKRRQALAGEAARIERAETERMREGRELVRDALSRSIFVPE